MSASDILTQRNGLDTTLGTLKRQMSGADAAKKANPQEAAAKINMSTANAMLKGRKYNLTEPRNEAEYASRLNRQTSEGMLNGSIPIVKTDEPKPQTQTKQVKKPQTYAEIFASINPEIAESASQRARRDKRERRRARIAALADGLGALANIYYGSQGVKATNGTEESLSKAVNKRKKDLDEKRAKNRAAWVTGYQRAIALDEQARKNNLTLAEQMRYHDMQNEISKIKTDQGQQRIDLSRYKIDNLNDYSEKKLQIDKDYKDGLLSERAKSNAIAKLNADANMLRAIKYQGGKGSSSSRSGSYTGNVDAYIDLKESDPEGMAEAEREAKKMGFSPKTASGKAAARNIYKRRHANKTSGGGGSKPSGGGNTAKKPAAKKPAASAKKKTGVNWGK